MQIAPIRPYNMSQKQSQQNTNFNGVAFKINYSSEPILELIKNTKIPSIRIDYWRGRTDALMRDLSYICNSTFVPKVLQRLLADYEKEGLIDKNTDYKKLSNDIWPDDTYMLVNTSEQLKENSSIDYVLTTNIEGKECYLGKFSKIKEGDFIDFGSQIRDLLRFIEQRGDINNEKVVFESFVEQALKSQDGYINLITALKNKNVF